MAPRILDDADVERLSDMRRVVPFMREVFESHGRGELDAPARFGPKLPSGQLTFTLGGCATGAAALGFRVYDLAQIGAPARSEATVVFCARTGALRGVVTGRLLGAVRTGAIGGVAIDVLARADARTLALVGTGYQMRRQLDAALAVRRFETIRVHGRDAARRDRFCREIQARHPQLSVKAMDQARDCVEGADVVVCATSSARPVLQAQWLSPGTHVNHVGPSLKTAHEIGVDVAERAELCATDSLAQCRAEGEGFLLHGSGVWDRLLELGALCSRPLPPRKDRDVSVFFSQGLAGTEVLLANLLLEEEPS